MNYIPTQLLKGDLNKISCVGVINPNTIVSGGEDGTLKILDVKSKKVIKTLTGHTTPVNCVAVVNENIIVSGCYDNLLKIWE